LHWLEGDGVDDNLIIPGSASTFKFMHDGTGGGVSVAVMSTTDDSYTQFIASQRASTSNVGFALLRVNRSNVGSENKTLGFEGLRGVFSALTFTVRENNEGFVNIPYVMRANYKNNGQSDDANLFVNSLSLGDSPTVNSPSAEDSTTEVALFGNYFINASARIYGAVLRDETLLGTDGENVDKYLANLAGVTL